jgi:preprotein translocase subunit SecG
MAIVFALLSVILFLDCVVLVFLILLQLPKKEAGAGTAFGGAATDALFGAGSGNALTTITKYSAGIFFGTALIMALITTHRAAAGSSFEDALSKSTAAGQTGTMPSSVASNNTVFPMGPLGASSTSNSAAPTASSNSAVPPASAPKPAAPATTAPPPKPATNK